MSIIKIMSDDLANKIAAGEVVERPLSVVKELVENSIDANSENIYITLKNSGVDYIGVVDDGKGMDKQDANLCFQRHASSKLTDEAMLFKIATLGFRGEALSSIAAVSNVVLETCDGNSSTKTVIEFGNVKEQTECAYRKGTSFEITKLFHNTPARLKYLSNLYSELSKIIGYVSKCALANPNIGFKLMNDGKQLISTSGSGDMLKTVRDVYSIDIAKRLEMLEVNNEDTNVKIYAAKPDFQRSNKNYIHVFVNKRVVNATAISKAIIDVYSSYMPKGRYPFCIIDIEIEPELIDVNIHPNKYEIKFSKHEETIELIKDRINEFLTSTSHVVEIKSQDKKSTNQIAQTLMLERDFEYNKSEPLVVKEEVIKEETIDIVDDSNSVEVTETPTNVEEVVNIEEAIVNENIKQDVSYYVPIGQFSGTYILAQKRDELVMIDQHAAVERINYEKNKLMFEQENFTTINLLVPLIVEYSSEESIKIFNNIDKIIELQIDISEFGSNAFVIRSIPSWIEVGNEQQMIEMIIQRILNKQSIKITDLKDEAIESMSCKESLKTNARLSISEMEYIIDQIFKCDNPYHCPHGRPIIVKFTLKEIEKMFKRVM